MKKNHPILKPYRRRLRKRSTPAEQHLWHYLRDRRLGGWRFVRQYSVDFLFWTSIASFAAGQQK